MAKIILTILLFVIIGNSFLVLAQSSTKQSSADEPIKFIIDCDNGNGVYMVFYTLEGRFIDKKLSIKYRSTKWDHRTGKRAEINFETDLTSQDIRKVKELIKSARNNGYQDGENDGGRFNLSIIYQSGRVTDFLPSNIAEWGKFVQQIEVLSAGAKMADDQIKFINQWHSSSYLLKTEGLKYGVVKDLAEWEAVFFNSPPPIDFKNNMAVYLASYLPYHSGVYQIFNIDRVLLKDNKIAVIADIVENETVYKGGSTIIADIVEIPKSDLPVEFIIKGERKFR